MKKISFWAARHVKTALLLIVLIKIVLLILACYIGVELYRQQIILPANEIYLISLLVVAIVIAVYPSHKKISIAINKNYAWQKICDFILPVFSFLVIATMVNNGNAIPSNTPALGSHIISNPTAAEILSSGKTKGSFSKKEKRILKKEFYKQLKVYAAAKMSGDEKTAGAAWKMTLAIIAAVGLTFLLAAAVCSLSCSGADAAAVLVGILGLVAIIWGLTALIKRIKNGPKKKTAPKDD